jgi:spore coat polysaccharide biosynthesis protein SpsF
MDISGRSMLQRVLERVRAATLVDSVVVATSTDPQDDQIEHACKGKGVFCVRGSESDVLDRYRQAAEESRADIIIRITSDCPLLDPDLINQVITALTSSGADYASNFLVRRYPRGLDCEVFTRAALERAWKEAKQPYEREHVTPYIFEHPELFKHAAVTNDTDLSAYRWTVDTPEDLEFIRAVHAHLAHQPFTWRDVVALLEREPHLLTINQSTQQKDYRNSSHG